MNGALDGVARDVRHPDLDRRLDEFGEIARLFRPLTRGAPGAFDLMDDAAVIPQRPGFDLVVTKDAIVEGVHFPVGEAPELVARKLVAGEPLGPGGQGGRALRRAFLAVAWPDGPPARDRERLRHGAWPPTWRPSAST